MSAEREWRGANSVPTDCQACDLARVNPRTVHYTNGCLQCTERSLANSPAFHDSQEQGSMTPAYRDALKFFFGDDAAAAHGRVRTWAGLIRGSQPKEAA